MLAAETTSALNGIFDGLTGIPRVAVAVSGGSDSMALLHLVLAWQKSTLGPRDVYALTVDHGLRPESAEEAAQVARWCQALGVPHETLHWQGVKPTTGLQAKARTSRYDLMSEWCRKNRVDVLMTGHTADDQAETVYMRMQRSNSDRSLAGIWPENEWLGIKLLRPLLQASRQDLRAYLKALPQAWLEDPSNDNTAFERVRARQALSAGQGEGLNAAANDARERVLALDAQTRAWLKAHVAVDDYAVIRFPRSSFISETRDVQVSILTWALMAAGDGQVPERASCLELVEAVAAGRDSRRSLNGAVICPRRHVIEVMREPGRMRSRWVVVPDSGQLTFDGRFLIQAPGGTQCGPMGEPPHLKRPKDVPGFAFRALPVIKLNDGQVISPVKSGRLEISATLCERFRL